MEELHKIALENKRKFMNNESMDCHAIPLPYHWNLSLQKIEGEQLYDSPVEDYKRFFNKYTKNYCN